MQITHIPDDGQVQEPGAYRMSMALYHSQKVCPGPSLSSGGVRKIVSESPWAFWAQWEGNPNRYEDKDESDALILGKAAHALILGDEVFEDHFIYVPDGAPNRPTKTQIAAFERTGAWSEAAAPGAKFWAEFDARANGRSMLTAEQVTRIGYMAENIKRCPVAVEALTGRLTEVSMIWQDEITGVWLKSRPDVIPDNGFDFGDLKTFAPRSKSIQRAVHQAITDNGYAIQMALAAMGAEVVFGAGARECVLVMAQSTAPYTVTPVRLDEDALYWARVQTRHGIDTFARCLAAGHWPMPVEGIMTYSLPDSVLHRFGEAQINGDIPNIERNAA
jgi:hypothetical protein